MLFKRNTARSGGPEHVEPYATTPQRAYPYPLRSWAPDVAIDVQNLATAIDTDVGTKVAAITPAAGFAVLAGGYTLQAVRSGPLVFLQGIIKSTATVSMPSAGKLIATVPTGYRPLRVESYFTAEAQLGGYRQMFGVDVYVDGSVWASPHSASAVNMTTSDWIAFNAISYPLI